MHNKLSRLVEPNLQPYYLCMVLFILVAIPIQPLLAIVEAVVLTVLYIWYRKQSTRRRNSLMQYLEALRIGDQGSRNALLSIPLPVAVFRANNGEILWANDIFLDRTEEREPIFNRKIGDLIPDFDYRYILSGDGQTPELVHIGNGAYHLYGSISRLNGDGGDGGQVITAYFVDVTETQHLRFLYDATRPVVTIFVVDNYDELLRSGGDAAKSAVLAQLDERINQYVTDTGGLLRRYDRDRYLFVCEDQDFARLVEEKFSILEDIHQITGEDGLSASLSIGVGKDCENFADAFRWAEKSIEMALSRGGDQAVVKNNVDFQFYGGRSKSPEKRTKVKSRVMAKALGELIADATQVYVMGHQYADMDAVGAATGICCAARKRGKRAQIVIDLDGNNAQPLVHKIRALPEYEGAFISGPDAFLHAQPGALLVVVDTNRPDLVESRQLLDACNRVAVIDHHRRAACYIENAALNFHEPYASSASEMVTELLQYMVDPGDLLETEAEALLSGIVLDTKNFILHTGGRTFEAAAFLRRAGADTIEVRRYFQSDLDSMVRRYDIIRTAQMVHGDIAVAVVEKEVGRVTAAKAADDLLTLQGVQASFVIYKMGENVSMSARSLGDINVQVILEPLGGGGNAASAGGVVQKSSVYAVQHRLMDSINAYFDQ